MVITYIIMIIIYQVCHHHVWPTKQSSNIIQAQNNHIFQNCSQLAILKRYKVLNAQHLFYIDCDSNLFV